MDTQPLKNKKPVLRRREVIQGAAGVGILLALGAYGSHSRADTFIRPPGVRSDKDFFERCLRCDRCRSVCPTHVIRSGKLEDGLTEIRSPIMDFHLGHCDFCSKCIEVCSLGALQPIDKEKEKIGLAELTEICLHFAPEGVQSAMKSVLMMRFLWTIRNGPLLIRKFATDAECVSMFVRQTFFSRLPGAA